METTPHIAQKHEKLKQYVRELESVAVAFSGGVDSSFLLKTAHDVLGDRAIANVAEGSNLDDNGDYRPGLVAVAEQGVKSPLRCWIWG
jgi:uncharacterized protein